MKKNMKKIKNKRDTIQQKINKKKCCKKKKTKKQERK